MASISQPTKGRDAVLPTLDELIQALNIANDASDVPPTLIALASASTLLTMIRVSVLLFYDDESLTCDYLGHSR